MRWLSKTSNKIIMLLPTLAVYLIFIIMPVFVTIYYSFTKFTGIGETVFIGLKNYRNLFRDPVFFMALKNTCIVLSMTLLILLPLSFTIAIFLEHVFKGSEVMKGMIFAPYVITPVIVGVIWIFILDPHIGILNALLRALHLDVLALEWIGGTKMTAFSISIVYMWQVLGFYVTIFIAGLRQIPFDIHEASQIDGASKLQNIFFVTIPMLKETITIEIVLTITGAFKIFETVQQLTNGGPSHTSEVLVTYMYFTTFTSNRYGYGMAVATISFLFSALCSVLYLKNASSQMDKGGN